AAEVALVQAEKFASLARLRGGRAVPEAAIDHAWRQLAFASHHDAITGSESDQVYIDLLGLWRGAWSTARSVRADAVRALIDPAPAPAVTVVNPSSADR